MTFDLGGFRERIIEHLMQAQSDSISGIARALSEDRERPVHRLTIAGYLAAMTEAGILRELDRPPSKHYQIANRHAHKDIYHRIAQAVRDTPMAQDLRGPTALAALVAVLGRPVFRAELHHARIQVPEDLPKARLSDDDRRLVRSLVPTRWPAIDLPRADPLYDAPALVGPVDEVIRRALLHAADAISMAWEPQRRPAQAALPLEARD